MGTRDVCECGCGEYTTRIIMCVRDQDLGTVETLHGQTTGMLVPVSCRRGHERPYGLAGYANGYGDLAACRDYREPSWEP